MLATRIWQGMQPHAHPIRPLDVRHRANFDGLYSQSSNLSSSCQGEGEGGTGLRVWLLMRLATYFRRHEAC